MAPKQTNVDFDSYMFTNIVNTKFAVMKGL